MIIVTRTYLQTRPAAVSNNRNKKIIFRNFPPLNDYISEIKNKEIDLAKHIDVVMPMCNLIA